jgi:hypothetical protein
MLYAVDELRFTVELTRANTAPLPEYMINPKINSES